ncbi:MAG TPA: hypothetical protein VK960_03495 [Acidimicrobiia bacterium]|nr:hypothetical protein [Acidimicrobiia bacterium]
MPDSAFTWDQRPPRPPPKRREADPAVDREPAVGGRIDLRDAEHRFGVSVATLRRWARDGAVDAVKVSGPNGRQWMVTAESVAHRLAHRAGEPPPAPRVGATGPTADGSAMLVPRDAWDRLMDQLGNIHEAGLLLAEARERAAKAETEAEFLRERLGELRAERDELTRPEAESTPEITRPRETARRSRPTAWEAIKTWWKR